MRGQSSKCPFTREVRTEGKVHGGSSSTAFCFCRRKAWAAKETQAGGDCPDDHPCYEEGSLKNGRACFLPPDAEPPPLHQNFGETENGKFCIRRYI